MSTRMQNLKSRIKRHVPPSLWGAVRVAYRKLAVGRYPARIVTHRYGTSELRVCLANPTSAEWYDWDWDPPCELEQLKAHGLRPGATVFNLGAHQCVVAMLLAEAVGPQGKVVAVEASAFDAKVGEKNRRLNNYQNIEILHAAVAERSGTLTFTSGGHVHRGKRDYDGRVPVQAFSIDDLSARHGAPQVLFIDVEGYEVHALRGAAETLKQGPDCFVEVHVGTGLETYGESVDSVVGLFPSTEYDLFFRNNDDNDFLPFRRNDPRLNSRFYLLALRRSVDVVGSDEGGDLGSLCQVRTKDRASGQ